MEIKEILEKIALPARSGKKGFKVTEKLEAIESLLSEENSQYKPIFKGPHVWIFGKEDFKFNFHTFLVSSHADIVDSISKPFSEYIEDEKYFKGTYDNLGTNAACVELMLNRELPENVYFAFTADEETGRCNGADYVLSYIQNETGLEPTIFALDVTEEGYDNDRLFTIEGLHGKTENERRKILSAFMETEGNEQSFEVVKLKKKDDNSFLPENYQAKDITEYDESVFYAKHNCNSCSICLPGDGSMHSNSGFFIKEAVMKGYCISLYTGILSLLSKNVEKIEELKTEKDNLIKEARETDFHKIYSQSRYTSYYTSDYGNTWSSYWANKRKQLEAEDKDIPGQMHLSDYDDSFDYDDDYDYSDEEDEIRLNDPFMVSAYEDEFYEFATVYNPDEFDMFYNDILYSYGFKAEDALEKLLSNIFAEVHMDYEDDYYYE